MIKKKIERKFKYFIDGITVWLLSSWNFVSVKSIRGKIKNKIGSVNIMPHNNFLLKLFFFIVEFHIYIILNMHTKFCISYIFRCYLLFKNLETL